MYQNIIFIQGLLYTDVFKYDA